MTIDQIQQQFAAAADDAFAPPARVSSAEVYRAGVRRRRMRWWVSGTAVAAVAVAIAGGAVAVTSPEAQQPASTVGPQSTTAPAIPPRPPGPTAAPPDPATTASPLVGVYKSCLGLADAVTSVLTRELPAEITWSEPDVPADQAAESCAGGGIFWVTFTLQGQTRKLGFEGGPGATGRGCDPERQPVRCDQFPGGEVGHLDSPDEYAVVLSRDDGLLFFLGIMDGGTTQPITTAQLAKAAQQIAADVFR